MQTQRNTLLADLRLEFSEDPRSGDRLSFKHGFVLNLNYWTWSNGSSAQSTSEMSTSRAQLSDNLRKTSVLNESNVVHLTQ